MEYRKENMSLVNKRLDNSSSYWKKKYTLLLKKTEDVEKQNLRMLNRLHQIVRISKRQVNEKRFLMKRLDSYGDDYKKIDFFQSLAICNALLEPVNHNQPKLSIPRLKDLSTSSIKVSKKKIKKSINTSNTKQKPNGPKKPLNAFLWFCQEQREIILNRCPGMSHQELTKQLSVTWNTLEEKEKEVYYEMFDKDKLRYEKEMQALQSNGKSNIDINEGELKVKEGGSNES